MSKNKSLFNRVFLKLANSTEMIAALYLSSIVVSAMLISVAEGLPIVDGLWWSCVTALTIGYGDISPETTFGRVIAIAFSHLWIIIIIPLIIANFIVRVIDDANAFTHEEQEMIKKIISENNFLEKENNKLLVAYSEKISECNDLLLKLSDKSKADYENQ